MSNIKELLYQKGLLEKKNKNKNKEMALEVLSVLKASSLNALIHRYFSKIQKLYPDFFNPLKEAVIKANIPVNPDTYIGSLGAMATFTSLILLSMVFALYLAVGYSFYTLLSAIIVSIVLPFIITFLGGYVYPYYVISERKRNINNNIPFALNHLAAISYASVPLDKAFKMMIELADYGEITEEFKRIIKRMEILGEDIIQAMKHVALVTPSDRLKAILFGIISIIESGGNLREYLKEMSRQALFTYRLERKKYLETLQTYADIYTAVLITAPLFLITILAVINVVPDSTLLSYKPETIMKLGIYIFIPVINSAFLLFLHLTQPEV